jgi:hypothetical protein
MPACLPDAAAEEHRVDLQAFAGASREAQYPCNASCAALQAIQLVLLLLWLQVRTCASILDADERIPATSTAPHATHETACL